MTSFASVFDGQLGGSRGLAQGPEREGVACCRSSEPGAAEHDLGPVRAERGVAGAQRKTL